MANLKTRLLKLENVAKNNDDSNITVIFIDDICSYGGEIYTSEEFYIKYPDANMICIEIE